MDYAQARLQARFGSRPVRAEWQRLDSIGEIGAFLEAAKRAGLGRWLAGLDEHAGMHRVEIALRERLRDCIRELASWMPSNWQSAMLWTSHLVDLPALVHLARGGSEVAWMRSDPVIGAYLSGNATDKRHAILSAAQRKVLVVVGSANGKEGLPAGLPSGVAAALKAWTALWLEMWPRRGSEERTSVTQLMHRVGAHLQAFETASSTQDSPVLRRDLEEALRRDLRRSTLLPGAAFAYLAISALDLERVRSMILGRIGPGDTEQVP